MKPYFVNIQFFPGRMTDDGWRMMDDGWRMTNDKRRMTDDRRMTVDKTGQIQSEPSAGGTKRDVENTPKCTRLNCILA